MSHAKCIENLFGLLNMLKQRQMRETVMNVLFHREVWK